MVESLCPLFDSSTVDLMVDSRVVNTKAIQNMVIQLYKWSKDLENAKFLNANPVKKASVLEWCYILSKAFTNIRLYPKAPSPAPLSPKDVDSPSPLQTHPLPPSSSFHCLCGSTGYFSCWCYCRWQRTEEKEGSGTFWNIIQHDTCSCWSSLLPPPVLHDTHPLGGKNHMHYMPAGSAYGPVIQRPGKRRCSFNTSNGPSHEFIVVVVESKIAPVAFLLFTPQVFCLIDSFSSLIMVESFHLSYGGLCLTTTSVPTPSDLSRVETFVCTLVSEGSTVRCEVPSSHSFCKLIGVPFLCGSKPINPKDASLILSFFCLQWQYPPCRPT